MSEINEVDIGGIQFEEIEVTPVVVRVSEEELSCS